MPLKINAKSIALYSAYAVILICINFAVSGIPLSLGLCFAMLICGANVAATTVIYILAGIVNLDIIYSLLNLFEGCFLCAVTLIYRKTHKKIRAEAAAYMCIALSPFIAFSRWQGSGILAFFNSAYVERAVAAVAVIIFAFFCFKGIYALFFRLYRCKLRVDELICLSVIYTVFGIGLYNLVGLYAFICLAVCVNLICVRLYKTSAAVIYSAIIFLPLSIVTLSLNYLTAGILLCILTLLFAGAGRGAPTCVGLFATAGYLYFNGFFDISIGGIIVRALILICCCLITIIPSDKKLTEQLNLLTVKKVIPQTLEERIKFLTSEKLFRLSEVFREIECAFENMDDDIDKNGLHRSMLSDLKDCLCANCNKRAKCFESNVYVGFDKLIERGCIKGKVTLVDLPSDITANCVRPAEVIEKLNKLLVDYRRYMIDAENMKSGRKLLANQAKGISEVLKNCGVDFCRGQQNYCEQEKKIQKSLSERGISCPEIKICGEENLIIFVTVVGKVKIAAIREALCISLGKKFILKDKVIYDGDKSCLIFSCPPPYDAAFGVAYAVKDGEKISGDTHSVIKINEHSFLMALSDGMGSGEYAKKVSAAAISLIEAFYRAEMPTDTVLDTINKLICFNRDERFTCIDIAAINLNTLSAGFIKIGSPAGIIARKGEIKVLESNSLPLGILDSIHPTVSKEQLRDGDIVVFMSDGITSAFPSATDLYEFLGKQKALNPQSLADKILNGALARTGTPLDDMTVVCTRIYKRVDE